MAHLHFWYPLFSNALRNDTNSVIVESKKLLGFRKGDRVKPHSVIDPLMTSRFVVDNPENSSSRLGRVSGRSLRVSLGRLLGAYIDAIATLRQSLLLIGLSHQGSVDNEETGVGT